MDNRKSNISTKVVRWIFYHFGSKNDLTFQNLFGITNWVAMKGTTILCVVYYTLY